MLSDITHVFVCCHVSNRIPVKNISMKVQLVSIFKLQMHMVTLYDRFHCQFLLNVHVILDEWLVSFVSRGHGGDTYYIAT